MWKMVPGGRRLFITDQTSVSDKQLSKAFMYATKRMAQHTLVYSQWPKGGAFWSDSKAFNEVKDFLKRGGS